MAGTGARKRLMTQAEYASLRGVSRQAIGKLVRQGKLSLVDGRIDPDVADMQLARDLNPAKSKALSGMQQPAKPPLTVLPGGAGESPPPDPTDINTYAGARARREKAEALRAELEYERLRGAVVPIDDVKRAAFDTSRLLRDTLLGLPVRLGPSLAGLTDPAEVVRRMEIELRRVLETIAKAEASTMARLEA